MANIILLLSALGLVGAIVALSVALAAIPRNSKVECVANTETTYETKFDKGFSAVKPPKGGVNQCNAKKVIYDNIACYENGIVDATAYALGTPEQSGVNVTKGYNGTLDVDTKPITDPYYMEGMCPVNVHWHLGTEHLSVGQFDENGKGPDSHTSKRYLAEDERAGFRCHHYDDKVPMFTKEYKWQHCVGMHVGETYEVHWPHSNVGSCATLDQYQTPFYDGVFCKFNGLEGFKVGVQSQVFTIVNDESYYYPDLLQGMTVDGDDRGKDLAIYTGSTTGTTRNNEICSQYTGITWQVDRKCHLISASSFDKMCSDMKAQRDDMSDDLHPHGSRELVNHDLAANNHATRRLFEQ